MARHEQGLAAEVVGRVRDSYVDEDGVTVITDLTVDGMSFVRRHPDIQKSMYEMISDQYRWLAGSVDDGPNSWAVLLAAAIVSLAIAAAILVEGLIF